MTEMTIADLHKKHNALSQGEVVLDVRTVDEYNSGHVPGSINIPVDELPQRLDELKKFTHIFIHCRMGGRAKKASDILLENGYNNISCIAAAGMQAWIEEGYPVEK